MLQTDAPAPVPAQVLSPERLLGDLIPDEATPPIPAARWYEARAIGDGLAYRFPAGMLDGHRYLTADFLVAGHFLNVFLLTLQEGEAGPRFECLYSGLNQCQARMRLQLEAVEQNRWRYEREGAWLKPLCGGERVDLRRVDRMTLTVLRKAEGPVRWCQTAVTATTQEPPRLAHPVLPCGPLVDALGQATLLSWPEKSQSADEVTHRLQTQLAEAPTHRWPESFSPWGGWREAHGEGTGFFRTHHDGRRWWLVDPAGHPFWSAGLDCVHPSVDAAYAGLEDALTWMPAKDGPFAPIYQVKGDQPCVNFLAANCLRAFGPDEWHARWSEITLAELRRLGINTVANWSEWEIAHAAGFPYVRPLNLWCRHTPLIFRDFPDVFHPAFLREAAEFAEQLRATVDDPAFIGYFLMNEPTWGFTHETPAAGMLFTTPHCATRTALGEFLTEKYLTDVALAAAWELPVLLSEVAEGMWTHALTPRAQADLAEFSAVMVDRLFGTLSAACKAIDPHHLNLGARYYTVPPLWAQRGMRHFDVFSINCYSDRVKRELADVSADLNLPILIGEWHFGALDAGLPGSGIGHVRDQAARGQAYRVYLEDAAAQPWCVGVHYFTLYDESALGRFDGENWNIGFLDICNRPYAPLATAARQSHERLYAVAAGSETPYAEEPEYLPLVFL
jgi:hypothetical protein